MSKCRALTILIYHIIITLHAEIKTNRSFTTQANIKLYMIRSVQIGGGVVRDCARHRRANVNFPQMVPIYRNRGRVYRQPGSILTPFNKPSRIVKN